MARRKKKRKNPRLEVNPGAGWWILGGVVVVGGLVAWKMLDVADDAFKSMTSEAKKKGGQIPDRTTPELTAVDVCNHVRDVLVAEGFDASQPTLDEMMTNCLGEAAQARAKWPCIMAATTTTELQACMS